MGHVENPQDPRHKTLYLCDPIKNASCKKTFCAYRHYGGMCKHTLNPEYARLDAWGKPMTMERRENE